MTAEEWQLFERAVQAMIRGLEEASRELRSLGANPVDLNEAIEKLRDCDYNILSANSTSR